MSKKPERPSLFRKDEPSPAEKREAKLRFLDTQGGVFMAGVVGSKQWPTAADLARVAKETRAAAEALYAEWLAWGRVTE